MGTDSGQLQQRRRRGLATYRMVRYADDFVVLVSGTRSHAEALREEVAAVLAPMGLRLSEAKTRVVHIDEGLDFLGWRIQRHLQRGGVKRALRDERGGGGVSLTGAAPDSWGAGSVP